MLLSGAKVRTALVVLLSVVVPAALMASDEHVISIGELRQQMVSTAQMRASNLHKTEAFLSSPAVRGILRDAKVDPAKIQSAVAGLSDDELADLASRTGKIQKDITAGSLSNQELTYIVIALATAVIIIVILKA